MTPPAPVGRWLPLASRYAEVAPTCCNACRSCAANNALALLGIVAAALATPVRSARTAVTTACG